MARVATLYEETALEFLARNKGIATRGVAARFGLTQSEARTMLSKLLTDGLIEMDSGCWYATTRGVVVASLA